MHLSHHASISYALHTLCGHASILRASIFCAHFFPFSANTSTASIGEYWRGPTCSLHAHNACCMRAICSLQAFCKLWQAFYRAHIFIRVRSSMRATGNTSAAILLQSKRLIDTLTSTHVSAWNARGDRFLASNFMKILREKNGKVPQIFKTLDYLLKIAKKFTDVD